MLPWRGKGEIVLIGHQPYGRPFSVGGVPVDRSEWFREAVVEVCKRWGGPVVFKPHPFEGAGGDTGFRELNSLVGGRMEYWRGSLVEVAARGVHALVTYDSNVAVDAVLLGIPVFVGGCTMADRVASKDLSALMDPFMPDRVEWAHWLAWCQWRRGEMVEGLPWKVLVEEWRGGEAA
jgi:hypothetical protein